MFDAAKWLAELIQKRDQLDELIAATQRYVGGEGRRRGRPPTWMAKPKVEAGPKKRGRPQGSKNRSAKKKPQENLIHAEQA